MLDENLEARFSEMGRVELEVFIEDMERAYRLLEHHRIDRARGEVSGLIGRAKKEKIRRAKR